MGDGAYEYLSNMEYTKEITKINKHHMPATSPESVVTPIAQQLEVSYNLQLTIPTMSQGMVTGHHINSYVGWGEESFLAERQEMDSSGDVLWHIKRKLAVFNDTEVLPQESTIIYRDGTMVTSKRTYTLSLKTASETLLIDNIVQMHKVYGYNEKDKMVAVDQTIYKTNGDFSRREVYRLRIKDGKSVMQREDFDATGKKIAQYPDICTKELIPSGVVIDV